jgi:hypothetical protein
MISDRWSNSNKISRACKVVSTMRRCIDKFAGEARSEQETSKWRRKWRHWTRRGKIRLNQRSTAGRKQLDRPNG